MKSYYVLIGDDTKGPYTENQLRNMWNQGTITLNATWCVEGMADWLPMSELMYILEPKPEKNPDQIQSRPPDPLPAIFKQMPAPTYVKMDRPAKSKNSFQALALLAGAIGIHNLYIGESGKGLIQLILSVSLCWTIIVPVFVWIWALGEAFSTQVDGYGRPLE